MLVTREKAMTVKFVYEFVYYFFEFFFIWYACVYTSIYARMASNLPLSSHRNARLLDEWSKTPRWKQDEEYKPQMLLCWEVSRPAILEWHQQHLQTNANNWAPLTIAIQSDKITVYIYREREV